MVWYSSLSHQHEKYDAQLLMDEYHTITSYSSLSHQHEKYDAQLLMDEQ